MNRIIARMQELAVTGQVVMAIALCTRLEAQQDSIHEYLKGLLKPATVEIVDGDHVTITADFRRKNLEYATLFDQKAGRKGDQDFRFRGGELGIRLSNDGAAYVNCWFVDDVSFEIKYRQSNRPFLENQVVATVFRSATGQYVGNNSGTQVIATTEGGKIARQGKVTPVDAKTSVSCKAVMKDGAITIYRNGEKHETSPYSRNAFASGQVGFIWHGGASGNVVSISITGKLDRKKIHEEMQKAAAKKEPEPQPKENPPDKEPDPETKPKGKRKK